MADVFTIDGSQMATLRQSASRNRYLRQLVTWIASRKRLDSTIPKTHSGAGLRPYQMTSAMRDLANILGPAVAYRIARKEGAVSALVIKVPPSLLIQACRIAISDEKTDEQPEAVQAEVTTAVEISEEEAFNEVDDEIALERQLAETPLKAEPPDLQRAIDVMKAAMTAAGVREMTVRA